jgi:outer-membrane receptor for ferric coprogen and ferric-rhodotorulic acid
MHIFSRSILALSVASVISGNAYAQTNQTGKSNKDSSKSEVETLYIYGEADKTKTATKLNLTLLETPQVVSVISRDQIEDFSLREVNSLLTYVPGVTVEQVETGRTYYTARGFDIVNFQTDGMGVPFSYGLTQGHEDTAIYEQVEVVKGATGLITGLANPSATINYLRKRPTENFQASLAGSAGSWNQYRVDGDISGPIVADKIKGRLVIANQDGDSYLDRYGKELTVFYGIATAHISDSTRLTLGHSNNDSHSDGNSSGALPLFYDDGSVTDYDVSTNTAPDWAYQDVEQNRSFVELEQDLNENWMAKAVYTQNKLDSEWTSLYLSGAPDSVTETGLLAHASLYQAADKEEIVDLFVNGSFALWGQQHELVAGINFADIHLTGRSIYTDEWNYDPIGADWADGKTPLPEFDVYDAASQSTDINQDQKSWYLSTRLHLNDQLSLLLGARTVDIDQDGISYGAPQTTADDETVPYAGVTYEVLAGTMLYASYSEVFNPQAFVDAGLQPLGAVRGESREFGIKQEIVDGKAILTLARFESAQENFGEWIGRDTTSGLNLYRGVGFESEGYELELAGEIFTGLNISSGYTRVKVEDDNNQTTRRFIPKNQFKIATAYQLPMLTQLRLGAALNWQSDIYYGNTKVQGDYALLDLFARYSLTQNLTLSLNLNNITDEKYLLSPQWGQANYGAPRSVMGAISWRY